VRSTSELRRSPSIHEEIDRVTVATKLERPCFRVPEHLSADAAAYHEPPLNCKLLLVVATQIQRSRRQLVVPNFSRKVVSHATTP